MNQIGSHNTANIGTYNDVAGNQTNSYNSYTIINDPGSASSIQEQADIAAIRSLKIAGSPSGNQHQTCADNTRVQILEDIRTWTEDTTTTSQIFWLADRAGTGKSTVAKQIAKDWERAAKPVASFFFSINAEDTRTNTKFCSTVAAKLADLQDFGIFRSTLTEGLKQKITVETHNFESQFEELLCVPLKRTNKPVLLIIDALDECDRKDRYELLSVLLSKLDTLPMVKVMITSRPEPDITKLLRNNQLVRSSDLQGSGDTNSSISDVLQYISNFFATSDKLQSVQSYAPMLAKGANGLFIYASTACKYLQDSLDVEAAIATIESISGLDDLYSQIMERAIPKDDPASFQAVFFILQAILAAQRPLSVAEMQSLLKKGQVVRSVVETLASVLSTGAEDKPVEVLHPTFREYLTDRGRSGAYFIDVKKGHKSLAIGCLKTCSKNTTEEHLGVINSTLEYAVLYWPYHAACFLRGADTQKDTQSLEDQIISFFKEDLIYWFELTALLKAVNQCIKNLVTLETSVVTASFIANHPTNKTSERALWCRDAQRFLQYHQLAIEQEYTHVRRTLAFTPRESLIYMVYFTVFAQQLPTVLCGILAKWPSHQILLGHTGSVTGLGFSPDGTRIISCSWDHTLRLWDGMTGASIGSPMSGHTNHVQCVAFSPDGTRIASGSYDATVRLWDGVTGASIGPPMKGHSGFIRCLAFSPDGTRVVSGSDEMFGIAFDDTPTLQLWDGVTGASIRPMRGNITVRCVAFSPDGTHIASGLSDATVRLWDGVTGASIGCFIKGHSDKVNCVAFSPDGTRVVSGSVDKTVRLWNGLTGATIGGPMNGHSNTIRSVAFSPDGTCIVSGSDDCTLRLWDGTTGASIRGLMNGPTNAILQLWDGMIGTNIGGSMKGHTKGVNIVTFSPDGTLIASGSSDCTVRLWNGMTGAAIGEPMSGHSDTICSVSFSPDGNRIASGSNDYTLRLWDGMTGVNVGGPIHGHTKRAISGSSSPYDTGRHTEKVTSMAFSPDGTRVVSSSLDSTIRLWDGVTGASIRGPMKGHTGGVTSVAFSPDGTHIVSGSMDKTLRLWNGLTGANIGGSIKGHSDKVNCVAFSPDGTRIASCSEDTTIRLWDGVTGAILDVSTNNSGVSHTSLSFSPDGTRIVSSAWRGTRLGLWNVYFCANMASFSAEDSSSRPIFSICGSYIISENQIWDIRLLPPSLVTGITPAVPYYPVRYDQKARVVQVHASSLFTFPVSGCQVREWVASGGRIALGLEDGRVIIIDCTHLL